MSTRTDSAGRVLGEDSPEKLDTYDEAGSRRDVSDETVQVPGTAAYSLSDILGFSEDDLARQQAASGEPASCEDDTFPVGPLRAVITDRSDVSAELPHLMVIGGNNRGQLFPLSSEGDASIGRGLENDVVLADIAVSRHHTVVRGTNDCYQVRDLGSGNGTIVNGERVETHRLAHGDQIELGNSLLRFVVPDAGPSNLADSDTMIAERPEHEEPLSTEQHHIAEQYVGEQFGQHEIGSQGERRPGLNDSETDDPKIQDATQEMPGRTESGEQKQPSVSSRRAPQPTDQIPDRRRKSRFGPVIVISAVSVSALLLAAVVYFSAVRREPTSGAKEATSAASSQEAARRFKAGKRYFEEKKWHLARKEYLRVFALAPGFDEAKRYARKAAQEIVAEAALEKAKSALGAGDYDVVRSELKMIRADSVYIARARELSRRAKTRQIAALIGEADRSVAAGNREVARQQIERARKLAPNSQAVIAAQARIEAPPKQPLARRTPTRPKRSPANIARRRSGAEPTRSKKRKRVSDRSPGAKRSAPIAREKSIADALSEYRHGKWRRAKTMVERVAEPLPDGDRRRMYQRYVQKIASAGRAFDRAEELKMQAPARALVHYQSALRSDRELGGKRTKAIKKGLIESARASAEQAMRQKKYTTLFQALAAAKSNGAMNAKLEGYARHLEKTAMERFDRGYAVRKRDLKEARTLWQQVLRMVPPSSPAYQKAYSWLNSVGDDDQDEDEI